MSSRSLLLSRLTPLADILLRTRKDGCTTADLIEYARELGVLKGTENLSGLGHVFKSAGGYNSGETRLSQLVEQKGVRQVVWKKKRQLPAPQDRIAKDG